MRNEQGRLKGLGRWAAWLLLTLSLACGTARADVPWPQDTMYLIMVDRFNNGNTANDPPEPLLSRDHSQWKLYWGGDLAGITRKLDYLKALGVNALWITPIVKNTDAVYHYNMQKAASYHGYWADDFGAINPFFGSLADFDTLVAQAHQRGMKIVLDIVVNHTSPIGDGMDGAIYDGSHLLATYGRDPDGWFHHNGRIDFRTATPWDWQNKNLFDLADLNQDNPTVSNYLIRSYANWVARGVDGLRIDTARHVAPAWLATFIARMRDINPNLYVACEWSEAGSDVPEAVAFANQTDSALIDFRMHDILVDMFTRPDANWQDLAFYLNHDAGLKHADESIVYLDNHDRPRFMSEMIHAGCSEAEARQRTLAALDLVMTVRGIPCVYYDTEHLAHRELPGQKTFGGDPANRFMMTSWDTSAPAFQHIAALAALRRANPALGEGSHVPRYISQDQYVFERRLGNDVVVVAINKGDRTRVSFKTALPDGTYAATAGQGRARVLGPDLTVKDGECSVQLSRWEVGVWSFSAGSP